MQTGEFSNRETGEIVDRSVRFVTRVSQKCPLLFKKEKELFISFKNFLQHTKLISKLQSSMNFLEYLHIIIIKLKGN